MCTRWYAFPCAIFLQCFSRKTILHCWSRIRHCWSTKLTPIKRIKLSWRSDPPDEMNCYLISAECLFSDGIVRVSGSIMSNFIFCIFPFVLHGVNVYFLMVLCAWVVLSGRLSIKRLHWTRTTFWLLSLNSPCWYRTSGDFKIRCTQIVPYL